MGVSTEQTSQFKDGMHSHSAHDSSSPSSHSASVLIARESSTSSKIVTESATMIMKAAAVSFAASGSAAALCKFRARKPFAAGAAAAFTAAICMCADRAVKAACGNGSGLCGACERWRAATEGVPCTAGCHAPTIDEVYTRNPMTLCISEALCAGDFVNETLKLLGFRCGAHALRRNSRTRPPTLRAYALSSR